MTRTSDQEPSQPIQLNPEQSALVQEIVTRLGEKKKAPRFQILKLVSLCDMETCRAILEEALQIEANGGMMTNKGDRRRTPGGIFFKLLRDRLSPDVIAQVLPQRDFKKQKQLRKEHRQREITAQRAAKKGIASKVIITLYGIPDTVDVSEQDSVMVALKHTVTREAVPPNLPAPPASSTIYVVYMSTQDWTRISEALEADPQDEMVIEGLPVLDSDLGCIVVYATKPSTRYLINESKKAHTSAQS
jgi:hypothetical protein